MEVVLTLLSHLISLVHYLHVDFIIAGLSIVVVGLRLTPLAGNLRILLYAAQGGLFIAQMYKIYKAQRTRKNLAVASPKLFVADIAQHFLDTHPVGKMISKQSEVDEKVDAFILKHDSEVPGNG